jgi:hypothetical protein
VPKREHAASDDARRRLNDAPNEDLRHQYQATSASIMAEVTRMILVREQESPTDMATALGVEVPRMPRRSARKGL